MGAVYLVARRGGEAVGCGMAAARERGFTRLVTESQHENLPMRRLNEKLGYEPVPGSIVYRGPLAG